MRRWGSSSGMGRMMGAVRGAVGGAEGRGERGEKAGSKGSRWTWCVLTRVSEAHLEALAAVPHRVLDRDKERQVPARPELLQQLGGVLDEGAHLVPRRRLARQDTECQKPLPEGARLLVHRALLVHDPQLLCIVGRLLVHVLLPRGRCAVQRPGHGEGEAVRRRRRGGGPCCGRAEGHVSKQAGGGVAFILGGYGAGRRCTSERHGWREGVRIGVRVVAVDCDVRSRAQLFFCRVEMVL